MSQHHALHVRDYRDWLLDQLHTDHIAKYRRYRFYLFARSKLVHQ